MIDIFYYDKGLKRGNFSDLKALKDKRIWVDVTGMNQEECDLISNTFNLHPVTVEDLLKTNTIKIEEFKEYTFCVFYAVKKLNVVTFNEIEFILGKNFLITTHKAHLNHFSELKNNVYKLRELFTNGVDFIFYDLLDSENDNFFPILENINEEIEQLEFDFSKRIKHSSLNKLMNLKKTISSLRKCAFPQREKISYLVKHNYKHISPKVIPYLRDLYDHSIIVCDTIDNCRESIASAYEIYMSLVSNSTNQIMKILSIISTIALPFTAISGIYGMNFKYLPGSYHPLGFWLIISLMLTFVISMLFFFKRKNWI